MRTIAIFLLLFLQSAECQELRVTVERAEPKPFNIEIVKPQAGQDAISGTEARPADLSRYAVKLSTGRRQQLASGVNTSAGIVTCEHVVRGFREFTAECDGETAKAVVAWWDAKNDVALLSVKWAKPHDVPSVKTFPFGNGFRMVGRGDNGLIRETSHKFIDVNQLNEIIMDDARNSGASGSGVFNESGELVGIYMGNLVDVDPYTSRVSKISNIPQLKPKSVSSSSQIECTVHTTDGSWCIPCNTFKTNNGSGNDKIKFTYTTAAGPVDQIPCTTFRDKEGWLRYILGYKTTADILTIVEKYR